MIEKRNDGTYKESLIGSFATVKTKDNVFEGKITFETKNTIRIDVAGKKKTVIKKNAVITIKGKTINGEKITKRTEDRIKTR